MAKILTEVDAFSADVTVPEDGDAANQASIEPGLQKITNRTRNVHNRLSKVEPWAHIEVSGANVASGTKFSLDELGQSGGFILSSDAIEVPENGVYLAILTVSATSTQVTNPLLIEVGLYLAAALADAASGTRFSATTTHSISGSVLAVLTVAAKAVDLISVKSLLTNTSLAAGTLFIRRLA